jgi:hypothetical protein
MNASGRRNLKHMLFLAGIVLAVSGCVKESIANGERVFQYELWVPVSSLILGLAAIPIGLLLRNKAPQVGWGLIIVGPIAAIFFAPSLFRDRVVVSRERFHVQTGIWGLTAVHSLRFDEINQIRITAETTTQRRGGKHTNYFLNCDKKGGGSNKVSVNNTVTETSAGAILHEARAHGIPIRDETGGQ